MKGALLLTFLAGCVAPPTPTAQVQQATAIVTPATAEKVAQCAYLDDVIGASGWYGLFASQGVENARGEALLKASSIGATHIVWQAPSVVYGSTSVQGRAYRCSQ